nr:hypothetical protein [Candidatus Neomarinimicrobiota bacterium]
LIFISCADSEKEKSLLDKKIFLLDKKILISSYETTLTWLVNNAIHSNNGYIIIDDPASHYEISLITDIIPEGIYTNIPNDVLLHTVERFRGVKYVLVSNNLIYISDTTDFSESQEVLIGDLVQGMDKWFLTSVETDTITFNYGWLYVNAWLAESLIDMYSVTSHEHYLYLAREYLNATTEYISEGGKWLRYTAVDSTPKYIAMSQAIFMHVLHKFVNIEEDVNLSSILDMLSRTFQHGTEGVYNHWSNSRIGGMIRDDVIGSVITDYGTLQDELNLLYSRISSFNGKIPYIMDENNPNYPDFRATYQTYDTFLLAMMSKYALEDIQFNEYFQMCFNESKKVNYGPYFTNNTLAVLYMLEAYGNRNDEFMISQYNSSVISSTPTSTRDAVAKLRAISALMKYNELIE